MVTEFWQHNPPRSVHDTISIESMGWLIEQYQLNLEGSESPSPSCEILLFKGVKSRHTWVTLSTRAIPSFCTLYYLPVLLKRLGCNIVSVLGILTTESCELGKKNAADLVKKLWSTTMLWITVVVFDFPFFSCPLHHIVFHAKLQHNIVFSSCLPSPLPTSLPLSLALPLLSLSLLSLSLRNTDILSYSHWKNTVCNEPLSTSGPFAILRLTDWNIPS